MRTISVESLNDLADKIEALDLSEVQKDLLDQILDRAAEATPETTGFVASEDELIGVQAAGMQTVKGRDREGVQAAGMQLSKFGLRLGTGAGFFP